MSRKLLNLSIISVLMLAALTSAQPVQAQEPIPVINANITLNGVGIYDPGSEAINFTLEVYEPDTTTAKCSGDYFFLPGGEDPSFDCSHVSIDPGDHIYLMADGNPIADHEVINLTVEVIDFENGIFSGSAPGGLSGWMYVCNPDDECFGLDLEMNPDGTWIVDAGPDLVDPNAWFNINIAEEDGDWSTIEIIPPQEITYNLNVNTYWVAVYGYVEGPHTAEIVVSREGVIDPIFQDSAPVEGEIDFWLDSWTELLPGDLVELYIDDIFIKSYVMQYLTFDQADFSARTFGGSADPGTSVVVELCGVEDCISSSVDTGEGTSWVVTFDNIPFFVEWFAAKIYDENGDATQADFDIPQEPQIDANVTSDWVAAFNFAPESTSARLEVYDSSVVGQTDPEPKCAGDFTLPVDWSIDLACWEDGVDIQPGDQVLLIVDGTQVKDHTVFDLTLDEVDTDEGYFAGTAPEDTTVRVDVCNPPYEDCISGDYVMMANDTHWAVYFGPGVVDPEAWFAAFIVDPDGDQTMAEPFWAPFPWFTLHPDQAWVQGVDWPIGVTMTLTVDDNSDPDDGYILQETQDSYPADWDPNTGTVWFDLSSVADELNPDMYVSLSDGDTFKDTWIPDFGFDFLDPDTYIASGFGPEGSLGYVCLDQYDDLVCHDITIPSSGFWEVDFSDDEIDLSILTDPHVSIWDDDGEEIVANLPMEEPPPFPAFSIQPDHGWVCTGNWPIDVPVTLTIAEDDLLSVIVYQESKNTLQAEWDPSTGEVCFDFYDLADEVLPGMYVTVSDGITTKDTWIQDLSFDVIDPDTFIAYGTGPGDGVGHACVDQEYDYFCHEILISSDSSWEVDFSGDDIDLSLIDDAHVVVYDEDGDETMAHLDLEIPPQPFFNVNLTTGIIHALGWPVEENLSLIIDDPSTPGFGDYFDDGVVIDYTSYDPNLTQYDFLVDDYEILPGFLVQISGSEITKEHLVTSLTITSVDYETNTAFGSAYPNSYVGVFSLGQFFEYHFVDTGADGSWAANFSVDIVGHLIVADEGDEDGDNTERIWFPNSPPAAADDFYGTDEDLLLSVEASTGVLSNDTDPENDSLEVILVDGVQNGNLVLNTDGSFSYTPPPNYFGTEIFSYRASDGSFESEIALVSITINPVNDVPQVSLASEFTIDEGQAFFGTGSFSDPDDDVWTGTVDYSDGDEIPPLTITGKSFELSHSYPVDDGEYLVTVVINDGQEEGSAVATVTVLNVAPSVSIDSIAAGDDFAIVGLPVHLSSTFFDPGIDSHSAVIDWGDGSQTVDPAFSPLAGDHVYQSPGQYTITVTVTDDDGGVGSAAVILEVVEPADAAEAAIGELSSILDDPGLDPEAVAAIEGALVNLEGANDGLSSSGALDKIDGGQWNSALVKINKAIQDLEEAQAADPTLDLSELIQALATLAEAVALNL